MFNRHKAPKKTPELIARANSTSDKDAKISRTQMRDSYRVAGIVALGAIMAIGILWLEFRLTPVPASEYQACVKIAHDTIAPQIMCATEQTLWDRTQNDPITLYTSMLTLFTAVLALFTIFQGRFLVKADRLAEKTSKNAELAMISSQRAYLFAEGYQALYETVKGHSGHHWRFRPTWRNSGDTPPKDTVIYTECLVTDTPLPNDYKFTFDEKDVGTGVISAKGSTLGGQAPRQINGGPNTAISPSTMRLVQKGTKFIYLWGWASYNDVFPNTPRHLTHFCWAIIPVGDPKARESSNISWNYNQHTRGNYFSDLPVSDA